MASRNGYGDDGSTRLRIVGSGSASSPFADRRAAGRLLAEHLDGCRGFETLVIGVPRGGMEVAEELALCLGADLDVFVARKIRAPGAPDVTAGAVAEGGSVIWNPDVVTGFGRTDADWSGERERASRELEARASVYRTILPRADVRGRTVLLADDGVESGATMKAAVQAIVLLAPASLIVAAPGGCLPALAALADLEGVDQVVALAAPDAMRIVADLYLTFPETFDGEVMRILRHASDRRAARAQRPQPA